MSGAEVWAGWGSLVIVRYLVLQCILHLTLTYLNILMYLNINIFSSILNNMVQTINLIAELYFCLGNQEGAQHVHQHKGALDERGEDELEEGPARTQNRHHSRTEGGGRPGGSCGSANSRELNQNEVDQVRITVIISCSPLHSTSCGWFCFINMRT